MSIQTIRNLEDACVRMRRNLLEMTNRMGSVGAHIGGSLSMVEIAAVLYLDAMSYRLDDLSWDERDRFILSKGHGVMAVYAAMAEAGIIDADELHHFKENGGVLSAHPSMNPDLGVEFSSGSLGQGLSLGVGSCLALRHKANEAPRVYVVVGDGECDEGQVWEAAMTAAHYKLDHLVCIVDCNHLQYDGDTSLIKDKSNLARMWESFGWKTIECDGHSIAELREAISTEHEGAPLAIVAHTVKGKGVSFMEGNAQYHNNRLPDEQLEQALSEVGEAR